jgi:predicted RNA-binding protein with PIN domain
MSLAREELIRRLTHYQDVSEYRVVAVFDGQGARHSDSVQPGGIQVFYSSAQQTADSIIERLVAKYGEQHDLTVVTNDQMERQTASTFGAFTLSVELFLMRLKEAEEEFSKELKKRRRRL